MRILIVGASGFLGSKMYSILKKKYKVMGTYYTKKKQDLVYLDGSSREDIAKIMNAFSPHVVINVAAMSNVDECEHQKEKALQVNTTNVQNIIKVLNTVKKKPLFVQISTDFVFDGNEHYRYTEADIPKPINTYGKTKLLAEESVQKYPHHLILRVSKLYGFTGKQERNFVEWVISNFKSNTMFGVAEHWGTPTCIDDVAYAIEHLMKINAMGIFHVVGEDEVSRREMAFTIAHCFGYNTSLIQKEKRVELDIAYRPSNSSLSNAKLKRSGFTTCTFEEGMNEFKKQMESSQRVE